MTPMASHCSTLALRSANAAPSHTDSSSWEKVVKKLQGGAMPPSGSRRPDKPAYQAFVATLDELARSILQCLADERPLLEVAHAAGISRSTVQSHKNRLSEAVLAFMEPGLLQELQRPTQWRINIRAAREKMACRFERQAA